jgi:8-oxo-dGTP pyrophosphatase MutT (NUDIX family)
LVYDTLEEAQAALTSLTQDGGVAVPVEDDTTTLKATPLEPTEYVVVFLFDDPGANCLLILKDHPHFMAGKWNGLGGKVLPGETPLHAAVREVKEESDVDLDIRDPKQIMLVESIKADGYTLHVLCGFTDAIFKSESTTDEKVMWFHNKGLPSPLYPDVSTTLAMCLMKRSEV